MGSSHPVRPNAPARPAVGTSPRSRRARALLGAVAIVVTVVCNPAPARAQLVPPVDGVVIDTFRPPAHVGAPGNRGWEYATTPGSPVRAVGAGVVVFAGSIGGARYVSIDHGGGLRTAYSYVAALEVAAGDRVRAGQVIATTGATFHFGARRNGTYIDPAMLFGAGPRGRPRLVIRPGRVR